jgi:SAM-dependent methyltransferase
MSDTQPKFDFIAAQLRKPSGDFAATIAKNMEKSNEALFDVTLQTMDPEDDQHLLEIGFASGRFLHKLFLDRHNLKVTGIDYSSEMVNLATMINSDLITSGSLRLEEGSSEHLPFEPESFDAVYANMVIYFWDHPEQHLREVWRVLKPAGKFYAGFRPTKSMQGLPFAQFGFTLYEPDEWRALLEKNGFELIRTERKQDPEMEANGRKFQLESVCMVAQKLA